MEYNQTDYLLMSIGDPVRAVRNKRTQQVLEIEQKEGAEGIMKLMGELYGQDFGIGGRTALNTGDTENGIIPFGMVGGRIKSIKPVKQIIDDIVAEADEVLNKLAARKYLKA